MKGYTHLAITLYDGYSSTPIGIILPCYLDIYTKFEVKKFKSNRCYRVYKNDSLYPSGDQPV